MPKGQDYKMQAGFLWFPSMIIAYSSPYWLQSSFMLHSDNETIIHFDVQEKQWYILMCKNTFYMNFSRQTAKYKMNWCFLHVT